MSLILTPSETARLLAQLGIKPQRKYGQNFLIDGNIVRKSLELADVREGDLIAEIGPGLGTLTGALLEAGAEVHAVEIDPTLCDYLEQTLKPAFPDSLFILPGDAVMFPRADCQPDRRVPFKIVANLPYAIATPWLDALLSRSRLPQRMTLMLQKEAADRYVAAHGSKSFGAISIFLQSAYEQLPGHNVSRRCFLPEPDVDSILLSLRLRPKPFLFSERARRLIRGVFTMRRKQIGWHAKRQPELCPWIEWLESEGVDRSARPESIPIRLWQGLEDILPAAAGALSPCADAKAGSSGPLQASQSSHKP